VLDELLQLNAIVVFGVFVIRNVATTKIAPTIKSIMFVVKPSEMIVISKKVIELVESEREPKWDRLIN
jgi:hypothetical protein